MACLLYKECIILHNHQSQNALFCIPPVYLPVMIAKLRKIKDYLTDVHAYKIIEAQAEARAEAARERDLEALKGISIE